MSKAPKTQRKCGRYWKEGTSQSPTSPYVSSNASLTPPRCSTTTVTWKSISRKSNASSDKSRNKANKSPTPAMSVYSSTVHHLDTTCKLASSKHKTTSPLRSSSTGFSKNTENF